MSTTMTNPLAGAGTPRILIVDDSRPTAQALSRVLRGVSYRTAIANSGKDALSKAIDPDGFAAVVVDIHLGDMNGLILAQKLREVLGSTIPILVLSGDTSVETLNSLHYSGITYFFSKPVNTAHLLQSLKEFVPLQSGAA